MRGNSVAARLPGITTCVLIWAALTSTGLSQVPRVVLTAPDTMLEPGIQNAMLNIYLSNFYDTIAGFQFVLQSQQPEVVRFVFSGDGFDTTGTLVSGFEYVQAIDRAGDQSELWFRCIANLPFDTVYNWGIMPQQGGVAVRLPCRTALVGDSSVTSILQFTSPTDFSDPWGNSIGVVTDTIVDTTYYLCLQWESDSCLEWLEVDPDSAGYDSMTIDSGLVGHLDSSIVIINDGSVTVRADLQCDFDGDGGITVADLTLLVQCLFGIPAPPPEVCQETCDPDQSGATNVADLTFLVSYLFHGGPPPQ